MPFPAVDLTQVRTYPAQRRKNRTDLEDLITPETPIPSFVNPDLDQVAQRIAAARQADRPVIWCFGAHVIKRGLSPLLIELVQRGLVTHLASNGAATIHDFEIALLGATSEDVANSLADGSFGMAEETGRLMNRAIKDGARDGLGLGEALGRLIMEDERFLNREQSVLAAAYRCGIPYTVHVALGTDIIHQHPEVDFAALGWASGQDFKIFTRAVCDLEGGVFCNFGSAVIGPEVFLKAVSIARNLGHPLRVFTTANFDLVELGDYRAPIGEDQVDYYYRPRKNIVNRPVMLGGRGFHITGDHKVTLPNLYHQVTRACAGRAPVNQNTVGKQTPAENFALAAPQAAAILEETLASAPELAGLRQPLIQAYHAISRCWLAGGTLFVAGNGGSMSDAQHISGELDKAYKKPRHIPAAHASRLDSLPGGAELRASLQVGLRCQVLGINPALASAVDNDFSHPHLGYAQELYALGRSGDVFLGISTSGNAKNIRYAVSTALLLNMTTIGLTGAVGGTLAGQVDIALRAPATQTAVIQTWHIRLYHCLCEMLEAQFFAGEETL